MQIQELFAKPIDREIQGVITVGKDEQANISQELDEYVVTRELEKHFQSFFEAYKRGITGHTPKMGVWISGFFGSGKSHFLKILSYLLGNRKVGERTALDFFEQDGKIRDEMVLADMRLATRTPTDVVLFNIDSKSDVNGKRNKDAIVNVFLRVFNEMQGYCGQIPYVADLERRLTQDNKYDAFKDAFAEINGASWEDSRQDFDFIQDDIVKVLVSIGFMSEPSARTWCENSSKIYSVTIEDFAKKVASYLDSKGPDQHIVFLADEVGQYIGEDSQLMLNLQTVTEDLGKECGGRAWIVVTSQEDIDSITNVKGNDFSKIQGRFDTRLSLSSANVDEVIRRRILEKTDAAAEALRLEYEQKATVIRNLISFNDTAEKKLYAGEQDFASVYPFVPYQFNLLADVLKSIRGHGASGKHLSEGERSMLALFKESADALKNEDIDALAPFHLFYDALENFLDHSHRAVITRAYGNSFINPENKDSDVFAVDVLKTLFMIKYIKEIDANIDNITSLMVRHMDDDRLTLKNKVEDALKVLTSQTLVQKNGSQYIFLTNEEQEINNEINKENVETSRVIAKVGEMIFEDILQKKKYQYPEMKGRYSFPFNRLVDGYPHKQPTSYDIGLEILTPYYDGSQEDSSLRMVSGQGKRALVALPADDEFLTEIRTYLKIEQYLQRNASMQMSRYEAIKDAKRREMKERNDNARFLLRQALRDARIYVNGDLLSRSAHDESARIREALGRLVKTVYFKLPYIDKAMDDAATRKVLQSPNQTLTGTASAQIANAHALSEVLGFISDNSKKHLPTSMKTLKDRFKKAPYGFVDDDIHWIVARLFKNGDIAFTMHGDSITQSSRTPEEIFGFITKKTYTDSLLMEERIHVSEKDKKSVLGVMQEVFHAGSVADDEDAIMSRFQKSAVALQNELAKLEMNYQARSAFPGKDAVVAGKGLMIKACQITSPLEFFKTIAGMCDDFLDFAEDYEPVRQFFQGGQHQIFAKALDTLAIYDDSEEFIADPNLERIVQEMREIISQKNPYSNIPKLPLLRDSFNQAYSDFLEKESAPVLESIQEARRQVMDRLAGKAYEIEKTEIYAAAFQKLCAEAKSANSLSKLYNCSKKADSKRKNLMIEMDKLDALIQQREDMQTVPPSADADSPGNKGGNTVTTPPKPVSKHVTIREITGKLSWQLETEKDLQKFLDSMRRRLEAELAGGKSLYIEF